MNWKSVSHYLLSGSTLVSLCLASGLALAQDQPKPATPPIGGPGLQRPVAPESDPLAELTEEKKSALRDAFGKIQPESRELAKKLSAARKELADELYAEKVDEATIRAKAAAIGKLEGDVALLRAQAFAQVRPLLKPAQIEFLKSKNMRPEMLGRMPSRPAGAPAGAPGRPVRPAAGPGQNSPDRPAQPPVPR